MRKNVYFCLLLLVLGYQSSVCQRQPWKFFTDTDGLASSFVTAIRQDKLGYLWILTKGGVCRYDGAMFERIVLDDSLRDTEVLDVLFNQEDVLLVLKSTILRFDGQSFSRIGAPGQWDENLITGVRFDRGGRLWIGTKKGLFSVSGEQVRAWGKRDGIPASEVSEIFEDRTGMLWVGFRNEGIAISQETDSLHWRLYGTEQGLPQNVINDISEDQHGTIWVSTLNGVARFVGQTFVSDNINQKLPSTMVLSITLTRDGSRWFRMRAAGLARVSGNDVKVYGTGTGLLSNTVSQVLEDRNGEVWLASSGGVVRIQGDSVTSYLKLDQTSPRVVTCAFEDREGILWFGTSEGLLRYDQGRFLTLQSAIDADERVREGTIKILEDQRQRLWFATPVGLSLYDGKTFRRFGFQDGIPRDPILEIALDDQDVLWILTNQGLYTAHDLRIEKISDAFLKQKTIVDVAPDKFGQVWCLTRDGQVIVRERGSFQRFDFRTIIGKEVTASSLLLDRFGTLWIRSPSRLIHVEGGKAIEFSLSDIMPEAGFIYSFLVSRRGTIVFATDKGLSLYSNGQYTRFPSDSLLNGNSPTWVYEDSSGTLWFGLIRDVSGAFFGQTASAGVAALHGKSVRLYSTRDGLPSNAVKSAFCDRQGSLWLLTERGIAHFDGISLTAYGIEQGLAGNIIRQALRDKNGTVWFIAQGGLSKFNGKLFSKLTREDGLLHPQIEASHVDRENTLWIATRVGVQRVNPKSAPPIIHISKVVTNEGPVPLDHTPLSLKSVTELTVRFRALSFRSADKKPSYYYKLEGYENEWHGPTDQTEVSYHNLGSHDYRFLVKCTDADLIESGEAVFAFAILPPFWKTMWFGGISAVGVAALLYALFKLRTRQLEKQSQALAQIVDQRTKQLLEEQHRSEELLHNILPTTVINELKQKGVSEPREYRHVSILFTDFMGFTNIASSLPADRLVGELNAIFKEFDEIIERHGIEKLKTIGDAYLIGSGLPIETPDHATRAVNAALDMQNFIQKRNEESPYKWQMRAGIHSGQVIAGIVGKKKFTYDVWGDTVNIASRMESSSIPGRINISAFTYDLVKNHFECEYRGKIEAKGKGSIDMYLVKGPHSTLKPES